MDERTEADRTKEDILYENLALKEEIESLRDEIVILQSLLVKVLEQGTN